MADLHYQKWYYVRFKFSVVRTPLEHPRDFTSLYWPMGRPTSDFHLASITHEEISPIFHQQNQIKVKYPEGGMYHSKFEPHIFYYSNIL